jgi:hypothetical protein
MFLGAAQARLGVSFRSQKNYTEAAVWLQAAVETLQTVALPSDLLGQQFVADQLREAEEHLKLARKHR